MDKPELHYQPHIQKPKLVTAHLCHADEHVDDRDVMGITQTLLIGLQ